ncbi:hypothetical protein Tco_0995171 [Tanacetum coccineum]
MHEMRKNYNNRDGNPVSKNYDTLMCESHEANYIQSEGYQNRNSHDSYSHQSLHDPNDSEKSLTDLNNDVKNNLEDFKRCVFCVELSILAINLNRLEKSILNWDLQVLSETLTIKSRFGGNDESKKMQKYILKQQFEGYSVSNSEGLHKGYVRVFESNVKGSTASSSSTQNVAFVYENTSSTNEVSTAYGASTSSGHNPQREGSSSYTDGLMYSFFANQSSGRKLQFDANKKTGRKLQFDAKEPVGFDKTKVECYRQGILLENTDLRGIKIVEGEMLDTLGTNLKTIGGDLEIFMNL